MGRRPNTRVDNNRPHSTEAVINAHATRPAVRARCHHVCEASTVAVQLPPLRTRERRGAVSGGAGSAADVAVVESIEADTAAAGFEVDALDDEAVEGETGVGPLDGGASTVVSVSIGSTPRPSWLTPANTPAPTAPSSTVVTSFAPAAGDPMAPVCQRNMRRR